MKQLLEQFESIIVFDVETTGFDHRTDEIIELAALKIVADGDGEAKIEGELDVLISLSKKGRIPPEITELTGIDRQMLLKKGVSKAEAFERFSKMLGGEKTLLVAYNAQFDLLFLHGFLAQNGGSELLSGVKMLDALTVYKDRREYPHKLSDAVAAYSIGVKNTHRALDDVKATYELLVAMDRECADLDRYINLFGYNPKYGVSGQKLPTVDYAPQPYNGTRKLYEA